MFCGIGLTNAQLFELSVQEYKRNRVSFTIIHIKKLEYSQATRAKSGAFGNLVKTDIHLQIEEIQMRRLLMSRLIRNFTVCFVNLFFHSNNKI